MSESLDKPRRRWPRFSLLALILFVILAGVGLWLALREPPPAPPPAPLHAQETPAKAKINEPALTLPEPPPVQETSAEAAPDEPEPAWLLACREALDRKVTFELVETPLSELIEFFQALTKTNMILDPRIFDSGDGDNELPITLKVSNMRLSNALAWVLRPAGLDYTFQNQAIFISTPDRLGGRGEVARATMLDAYEVRDRPPPQWVKHIRMKLDRRVSFEFVDTPLSEAVDFLQALTKTNLILDLGSRDLIDTPVNLRVQNIFLTTAFEWIVRLAGADYRLINGAVFISTPQKLAASPRGYSLSPHPKPGDDDWKRDIHRKLQRKVTFEFVETPFSEALEFFQTLTKINMILDPKVGKLKDKPITLKVSNITFQAALKKVLAVAGLDYTIEDHALFISLPRK